MGSMSLQIHTFMIEIMIIFTICPTLNTFYKIQNCQLSENTYESLVINKYKDII